MSLSGKLEAEINIKSPADKFHEAFGLRPHHISNMNTANHKIKGCDLHDGEWGKGKSIIQWNYVHDGKEKVSKQLIDDIDHNKYSIALKEIEGDLMNEFKSFNPSFVATPKGQGSMVHWTIEYEKLHKAIRHPTSELQFILELTEHIDDHLTQATPEGHGNPAA